MTIRRVVDESGLPRALIAKDAGISSFTIRSWLRGERTPEPESIEKLVNGLRDRSGRLAKLADELSEELES